MTLTECQEELLGHLAAMPFLDRLRRLFTLLVKYAVRDRQLPPRADSSPDGGGEEG